MGQMIANRKTVLLFHLAVALMVIWLAVGYHSSVLILLGIVYILTSLCFLLFRDGRASRIVIIPVALICAYELFYGISQLIGYTSSNHILYSITGSFMNPGPYGGFIAVCLSLLAAYCVKYKDDQQHKFIPKIVYCGVSIVAVMAIVILPSTQSRSSILALGCGMILLAFGTERIRTKIKPILKKYGLWILLGVAIMGIGVYMIKKPSADGRLFMDRMCIRTICGNGLKGAGIGRFGAAYGETQSSYFKQQIDEKGQNDLDWQAIDEHDRITSDCPNNAFNEYLFIGVESGPIAMLLFIAVIIAAIVMSFKKGTIWCYGLTTFAVFALFSYPLHTRQFQVLLPLLLAACASDSQYTAGIEFKEKVFYKKLAIMVIALMALAITELLRLPEIRQNKKIELAWENLDRWHKMEEYEYVAEESEALLPYLNNDYHFLFVYGHSLNQIGNYEKSDSILKMGTMLSCDPMFWDVMGNNSVALGRYREAEERYMRAFYMVPNRLYPFYLLAKLYRTEGDTTRFLEMADMVNNFVPKVESDITESLRREISSTAP